MEILNNLTKVTQPIKVELEFEPKSSNSEFPCSAHLPTPCSPPETRSEWRALLSGAGGCGVKPGGNNQVLTTENREEMESLVLTRITEAGWAGARAHRWTPGPWRRSWPRQRSHS